MRDRLRRRRRAPRPSEQRGGAVRIGSMRNRVQVAVLLAALLAGVLAGCVTPATSGYIIEKIDEPAHQDIVMECEWYRSDGSCRRWDTGRINRPARWAFKLRDRDGHTGLVEVDQFAFDKYQTGDWYPGSG